MIGLFLNILYSIKWDEDRWDEWQNILVKCKINK